jgi:predicted nucleotidyltransferase
MGSHAYGVASENSDMDVYGFCMPKKEEVFPHLYGHIHGFSKRPIEAWGQYEAKHIIDKSALGGRGQEYDITIYSIVKYFFLCMDSNPNMIDSLFTPRECIIHATDIGNMVRENRKSFLSKKCWITFKGYAYGQIHKMKEKNPQEGSKRAGYVEEFGYDVKYAYHLVRILDEVEQILIHNDIDLQRSREHLKAIRRGEVSEQEIYKWFSVKEKELEKVYHNSKIQDRPDETKIKKLLMECLEHHYGNVENAVIVPDASIHALREVQKVLERNSNLLE